MFCTGSPLGLCWVNPYGVKPYNTIPFFFFFFFFFFTVYTFFPSFVFFSPAFSLFLCFNLLGGKTLLKKKKKSKIYLQIEICDMK